MKKAFIVLPVFILSIFVSYNVGTKQATKVNEAYRNQIEEETLADNSSFICDRCTSKSLCTFYKVNGGNWSCDTKTILIEEVDASQLTGKVSIIDNGEIIFYSDTKLKLSIAPVRTYDYGDAFIISYSTDVNSDSAITRDFYKEVDGEYKLVKTIDRHTPRVTYYAKVKEINSLVTIFHLHDPKDKYSWHSQFYATPNSVYSNNDSEKWNNLVDKNIDSVFKVTGVHLENECNESNLKLCYENLYIEDIEVVK